MKNFEISLVKMGRSGNEKEGWSLEPDDIFYVWSKTKKIGGIMQAVRWAKKKFPEAKLRLGSIDKLDSYNYRCYPANSCKYYDDSTDLNSNSVGMVYVMIQEFRYDNNDEKYGEKMFYYDGEWHT